MPKKLPHQETLRQRLHDLRTTDLDLSWASLPRNGETLRNRYRVLEEPCYGLVAALRDGGLLHLLAEHAQLEPAPSLRPFPYRVPRLGRIKGSVAIWSPGAEQETDDATANARSLLWFAVAHAPHEFGADLFFWQQVIQSLRLYHRSTSKTGRMARPIARIQLGVCGAACALIDASHDGAGVALAQDADLCNVHGSGEIPDPQVFSTFTAIARFLRVHPSTLRRWRKKGILNVQHHDGKYVCSESQLRMKRKPRRRTKKGVIL